MLTAQTVAISSFLLNINKCEQLLLQATAMLRISTSECISVAISMITVMSFLYLWFTAHNFY